MIKNVGLGRTKVKWPYELNYDRVNHVTVDVLVVGGGLAGCSGGMAAARRGAKGAVADKAPIRRSGNGGAGMDHWNSVFDNPDSPITTEENIESAMKSAKSVLGHRDYIALKGTWDALLELEKLGLPIRDEDGDFEGLPTEMEDSKLMKAYNYKDMVAVKLRGGNYIKPVLYDGLRKEGAELYERVMVTSLLTEGGRQGRGVKVAGATGFSLETGEFYVFHAKSVVLSTGYACSMWIYSTEITGNSFRWDPNEIGEGLAMAYNAGADITGFFKHGNTRGCHPFAWPRFGTGGMGNTWFPCTIVDNNGKEVPWVDANGNPVTSVEARNLPADGQLYIGSGASDKNPGIGAASLIRDLPKRVEAGEYEMPFWADLSGMPEGERKSIWGMMIGNEGKTRYTIYDYYTRAGFNPDRDMLWCPISYNKGTGSFHGDSDVVLPWRSERGTQGEVVTDWNSMSSVDGVYCAGATSGLEGCSFACSSGFYAGARAAERAAMVSLSEVDKNQLDRERERVYAPLLRAEDESSYISWKELWGGTTRVMQTCCAEFITKAILEFGLGWLDSIKKTEAQKTFARNPHELARVMECETRITVSEIFLKSCLSKLETDDAGITDYEFIFNHLEEGEFRTDYREKDYWLKAPYEPTYLENYEKCTERDREEAES